jgi:outer membrane protein assembly factor BamB
MNFRRLLCLAGLYHVLISTLLAADWPQWGGTAQRNMVSAERDLPESFLPGEKDPQGVGIRPETTRNVLWTARLGSMACSSPVIANGRLFIGSCADKQGLFSCYDALAGKLLWRWIAPPRDVHKRLDGRQFQFSNFPRTLGVCSSAAVDGNRVYFVNQRLEVVCLDVRGDGDGKPKKLWTFDMWAMGVRPSDACNCSVLVLGDCVYACTSNGVDRDCTAHTHDEFRKVPAPDAAMLIVLEKQTGRLIASDDAHTGPRLLHGQWSSPSAGTVNGQNLVFLGGGDGVCYAFEALPAIPQQPIKLRTAWRCDCVPAEYKRFGSLDPVAHYCLGDVRRSDTINKNDGTLAGLCEIIATPVFHEGRVYVAVGRDPEHGRGRGALWCIDASRQGDVTSSGKVWCYQGLDRSLSTVSIADGLLYVADVAGRLHCLDARTGQCLWIHETKSVVWGSTLVADGKVYLPTAKHLWILAAGREKRVLDHINLGSSIWATPVAAKGVLYLASKNFLWAVKARQKNNFRI